MGALPKRDAVISIDQNSETGRLLKRAAAEALILEADGERFRIVREAEDPFANYDPERTREALAALVGVFQGIDTEKMKGELRAQRDQDSLGRPA